MIITSLRRSSLPPPLLLGRHPPRLLISFLLYGVMVFAVAVNPFLSPFSAALSYIQHFQFDRAPPLSNPPLMPPCNGRLVLLAMPRPFEADPSVAERQQVAIDSWLALQPSPILLLISSSPGIRARYGSDSSVVILDESLIPSNEHGTPYVNAILRLGQLLSPCLDVMYINSDIVLVNGMTEAVALTRATFGNHYLMIGRRCNVDIPLPVSQVPPSVARRPDGSIDLARDCHLDSPEAIDYFLFAKDVYPRFPDFLLGRMAWDNWLVASAMIADTAVVDASSLVTAVHLRHDHTYQKTVQKDSLQRANPYSGQEADANRNIWRDFGGERLRLFGSISNSVYAINAGRMLVERVLPGVEGRSTF